MAEARGSADWETASSAHSSTTRAKHGVNPNSNHPVKQWISAVQLSLGIRPPPKYPNYGIIPDRKKTFECCPHGHSIEASVLAEAGFYCPGRQLSPDMQRASRVNVTLPRESSQEVGDHAKCFYCGCQPPTWSPTHDAFVVHAIWSPECGYVHLKIPNFGRIVQIMVAERRQSLQPVADTYEEKTHDEDPQNLGAKTRDDFTYFSERMQVPGNENATTFYIEPITYNDVIKRMEADGLPVPESEEEIMGRDPAVQAVYDVGRAIL